MNHPIDFGRLSFRPPDGLRPLDLIIPPDRVDHNVDRGPDLSGVDTLGHLRQHLVKPVETLTRHPLGHHGPEASGPRTVLWTVYEASGVIKLRLADELEKMLEVGLGLAGKTDDEGRSHTHPRNQTPSPRQQSQIRVAISRTTHSTEHIRVRVLQRDVQIGAQFAVPAHVLQEAFAHVVRLKVHDPQPGEPGVGRQRVRQPGQIHLAALPSGRVLPHEHQLPGAIGQAPVRIAEDLPRTGGLIAALDARDRAEAAQFITTVGDLHVGVGRKRHGALPVRPRALPRRRAGQQFDQLPLVGPPDQAKPAGYLGDLLPQLVAVPLHQTPHHQDFFVRVRGRYVQDGSDGLFLGLADEAAGIQNDMSCVTGLINDVRANRRERTAHCSAVSLVLGAPESVEIYP